MWHGLIIWRKKEVEAQLLGYEEQLLCGKNPGRPHILYS